MGGSIVAVVEGEPTSVDPAFDYDFVSGLATSSITEPLLKFCEGDTALCPNLASDWTVSEDGLTYTLTIRDGVKFHDGTRDDGRGRRLQPEPHPRPGARLVRGLDARQRGRRARRRTTARSSSR